jgi:2'-5' RNA ligase
MRVFVAIDIDRGIKDNCRKIMGSLEESGADLKIVSPENLHITLKFLGEVREEDLERLKQSIGEVTGEFRPFRMGISGVGYFGSRKFPKVIWVGISEGRETISRLCRSLEERLSWVRKDGRKPSPHLTIARFRNPQGSEWLIKAIDELGDVKLGEFSVKEIKLKKSVLEPKGAIYSDLKSFGLGQKGM